MAKDDEKFSFETVAQVYREERQLRDSTRLVKLPKGFYNKLADYLKKLQMSYYEARQKDTNSSKTMMLEDEFNKAQKRALQIYELRERKVVLLALSAANGVVPEISALTKEERDAFDKLVENLKQNRLHILENETEDACESKTFFPSKEEEVRTERIEDKTNGIEDQVENRNEVEQTQDIEFDDDTSENPVLLILEDIPSFETEERTFNLNKNDTITLPKKYAEILCNHKKARVIRN